MAFLIPCTAYPERWVFVVLHAVEYVFAVPGSAASSGEQVLQQDVEVGATVSDRHPRRQLKLQRGHSRQHLVVTRELIFFCNEACVGRDVSRVRSDPEAKRHSGHRGGVVYKVFLLLHHHFRFRGENNRRVNWQIRCPVSPQILVLRYQVTHNS